MLRTEQRDKFDTLRVGQKFNGGSPVEVDTRVIRDQPDMLAAQRRKSLRFEDIEPGLHPSNAGAMGLLLLCAGGRKDQACSGYASRDN